MAQLPNVANTGSNTEKMDDFTPIPAGAYNALIKKSEFKQTKAKTGHYLQLQLVIIDGEFKGRVLFERLNLDNPNPTAVQIANKALNSICDACGKVAVEDSEELHGIPMQVKVGLTVATPTQPASNEIKFYGPYEGEANEPVEDPTSQAKQETAPAETKSKLPWEK